MEDKRPQTSWTGVSAGIVVFIAGIALLLLTFKLAYDQFLVPPESALHIPVGKPIDIGAAVQTFAGLVIRVLLLFVMAIIAAIIANRGIKMYTDSRHTNRS
ncbi:MAG: hypothetical protein QOJ65_2563 [Fimbriimonadaceae bacterium]|nr:hypothetical protein [Fimbriimonadaceae bacterium]